MVKAILTLLRIIVSLPMNTFLPAKDRDWNIMLFSLELYQKIDLTAVIKDRKIKTQMPSA